MNGPDQYSSSPAAPGAGDPSRDGRRLFLCLFVVIGIILMLLSAGQIIKYREVSKGIALFGAGILALLSGAVQWYLAQLSAAGARAWITRCALAAIAFAWCVWGGLIAYAHRVENWDEGAYMLSGMALRGYDVPYASHRAPVTGFLCAVFFGWDRFLNPVLLGALLIAMYLWVRRLLGPLSAALALLVLLCQNIFLESTVEILSELPASLLLLLGFISLSRERFWRSAVWFSLVVFTRWNLAPVCVMVFAAVLIRFGIRQALKFPAVGLALFLVWYGITIAMGASHPLQSVYIGNFLAAADWSDTATLKPDFLLRVEFYAQHLFFLTPTMFLALIANPVHNWNKHLRAESWIILVVLPLALLAYIVTMLNIGGLFPRFITPLIPSAVVSLFVGLSRFCDDFALPELSRIRIVTVALFFACAIGLWPLYAVVLARAKHNTHAVFSPGIRKELIALDRKVQLHGVPRGPLCRANGHQAMVEARHTILFPSARHDFNTSIIEEPDSIETVRTLAAACHAGDLLLVPGKYASTFQPEAILFADEQWAIVRNP